MGLLRLSDEDRETVRVYLDSNHNTSDLEDNELWPAARRVILKLPHGKDQAWTIQRLLAVGNTEKAHRLFEHYARKFRGWVYPAFFFSLPLLVIALASYLR